MDTSKNVYVLVIKNSTTVEKEFKVGGLRIAGVFYSMEGAWNEIERKVTAAMETIIDAGYIIRTCCFKENRFILRYLSGPAPILDYIEYSIVETTIR